MCYRGLRFLVFHALIAISAVVTPGVKNQVGTTSATLLLVYLHHRRVTVYKMLSHMELKSDNNRKFNSAKSTTSDKHS